MALIQVVFQLHRFKDQFVFGKKGHYQMLWKNKNDLQEFKKITIGNEDFSKQIILMGQNTFKSFDSKLQNRLNYVLSSNGSNIKAKNWDTPDLIISSVSDFKELLLNLSEDTLIQVIGGFSLIKELIANQLSCNHLHECHHDLNDYEINDLYITIFENDFNTTGELITVEQSDLQELVHGYQLLEIKNIDENINLYHYVKGRV